MKYGFPLFLLTVFAASLALPQSNLAPATKTARPAPKKSVSARPAVKKTASGTTSSARKTSSSRVTSSKKGKSTKKPATAAATFHSRQMAPTPDRYREIQQSLAEKGYLKSEPSGVWDTQSADALRQFQTDKKLSPTGKLSSASLIALGLGPKPVGDPPAAVPAAPPPEN
jgi:hypothetical protein